MNWTELIDEVARRSGASPRSTREVLRSFVEATHDALASGDTVRVQSLGTLRAVWRDERTLRSVRDARPLKIDGRYVPRFKASSKLRERLSEKTPGIMTDPAHQAAWRVATALIDDLDLYHHERAPEGLGSKVDVAEVRRRCEDAFGVLWQQVAETYDRKVTARVQSERDHLAEVAAEKWAA